MYKYIHEAIFHLNGEVITGLQNRRNNLVHVHAQAIWVWAGLAGYKDQLINIVPWGGFRRAICYCMYTHVYHELYT